MSPPAASASSSQRLRRARLRLSGADVVHIGAKFQGSVEASHVCVDARSGIESVTLDDDVVGALGVRSEKHRRSTEAARPVCERKKGEKHFSHLRCARSRGEGDQLHRFEMTRERDGVVQRGQVRPSGARSTRRGEGRTDAYSNVSLTTPCTTACSPKRMTFPGAETRISPLSS
jgi:plasmid stability protein